MKYKVVLNESEEGFGVSCQVCRFVGLKALLNRRR